MAEIENLAPEDCRIRAIRKIREEYYNRIIDLIESFNVKDKITDSRHWHLTNFAREFIDLFNYYSELHNMLMEELSEKERVN